MDARERILLTGERLIAERGSMIPLRDIALEAGQRNNSAVHYHFGSRDGLIREIVERRVQLLEKHQIRLLAEHEASDCNDDVRGLLRVLVRPMFHVPYEDGSTHYGRFLEQVRSHPLVAGAQLDAEHWPTVRMIALRLGRALRSLPNGLPATTRMRRLEAMSTVLFGLLADEERRCAEAGTEMSADAAEEVVDMLAGLLTGGG